MRLNDAFAPDPVFVDVPDGVQVDAPVLIVHWCNGGPPSLARAYAWGGIRTVRRRGLRRGRGNGPQSRGSGHRASRGGRRIALLCLAADPGWRGRSIARLAGRGTANSTLRTFTVGLGASDHRVRADVSVEGKDARSEILSAYLGDGTQVHDIRTLQDHVAPRTTSELLCQVRSPGPRAQCTAG